MTFRRTRQLVATLAACVAATTFAQSPGTPAQVPGFYRHDIGSLRVTALFDGVVKLPRAQLKGVDAARADALLRRLHVPETPEGVQTAINAYLVESGGRRVLVDAGTADCFGPGLGQVAVNLQAAGVAADQVDDVLLTHAHPDHLCGVLAADGTPAFPRATVWVDAREVAYWDGPDAETGTPEPLRFIVGQARKALGAYRAAGRLRTFAPSDTLPGGATALASRGHTPGHVSYLFAGGATERLLVWGDVVHYHAVQLPRPTASFEPDVDRAQAIASRRRLLADASGQGWWVAGAHLPFPGLGHVRTDGKGYAWVPAEYSPLNAAAR